MAVTPAARPGCHQTGAENSVPAKPPAVPVLTGRALVRRWWCANPAARASFAPRHKHPPNTVPLAGPRRPPPPPGYVITDAGFLPDHDVTICVTYTAEDISDYLTYTTGPGGDLYAELPTSPATGALHITATDHRTHPDGAGGLLWSNTQTIQPPKP